MCVGEGDTSTAEQSFKICDNIVIICILSVTCIILYHVTLSRVKGEYGHSIYQYLNTPSNYWSQDYSTGPYYLI